MASSDADGVLAHTPDEAEDHDDGPEDAGATAADDHGATAAAGGAFALGATAASGMTSSMCAGGICVGISPLLANVAMADSFHGTVSSADDPSTESRMCTEESAERMTSSTEGMVSLSEDSSGRDTYAQAHGVCRLNSVSAASGTAGGSSGPPQHADTLELDESDEQMNGLMGSYREISIEDAAVSKGDDKCECSALLGEDTEEEVSNLSPDSTPASPQEQCQLDDETRLYKECRALAECSKRPCSLHLASGRAGGEGGSASRSRPETSTNRPDADHVKSRADSRKHSKPTAEVDAAASFNLQGLQGLVLREGEMVSFVAEDLQEQIKRASPIVKRGETPSFPGSRSSTPSLYKQALTPQLAPIDPTVLNDIENAACCIAASVNTILENLTGTLHSMSSLTVDCIETYHDSVCKTCDAVDGNIKAMYQLMAKFEELSNLMRPVYRLSGQIKEIKRMLGLLEQVVASGGS